MHPILPVVRYLILCENVERNPDHPRQVTLANLVSTIQLGLGYSFPVRHPEFCVFIQMTECRGKGRCHIEIVHADTEEVVFRGRDRPISFGHDPLELVGLSFRIRNCLFSSPGLYWVQFWYNENMIAQQSIVMRGGS